MLKKARSKAFNLAMVAMMSLNLVATPIIAGAQTLDTSPKVSNHIFDMQEQNLTYLTSGIDGVTPVLQVDWLIDEIGQTVFCLDFSKASPNGAEFHPGGELDKKFTYLINAFYNGNANLTGDKRMDMYIIQAAIHAYDDPNFASLTHDDGTPYLDPNGIKGRIMALRGEAENSPETPTPEFNNSVAIQQDDTQFHFENGRYETALMNISVEGTGTVNAVVTNGTTNAQLVDENNSPISEVTNDSKVKIVVPVEEVTQDTTIGVSVKGTFENTYKAAFRYIEDSGSYQDIARFDDVTFTEDKSDAKEFSLKQIKGSVNFVKKGTDEKLLDGVTFNVLASDGTTVEKEIVTKDGIGQTDNLAYGVHYLVETGTLPSYILNGEKIPFTVSEDGQTIDLGTIYNTLKTGQIKVHKVDQDGNVLPGAEFTLTDNEGQTEVVLTDSDGLATFNIEANNVYSLEETATPEGYTGSFKEENITLENDGQVFEYTATNTLKTGQIAVHKIDQDGNPLANAEFTTTDENGQTIVKVTDEKGLATFDIEANHVYSLEETKNPEGYTGSFKQENITLENDGQVFEYTVKNTKDVVVVKEVIKEITKTFPQTGEKVASGLLMVGVVTIILSLSALFVMNRKNKSTENN